MQKKSSNRYHYDSFIIMPTLLLLGIGLVMVASSSMVISEQYYNYPFHFLFHQSVYAIIALILCLIIMQIDTETWYALSGYLLLMAFGLLVIVLIPGIGHEVNGSTRWLRIGPVSLQVSEVTKLFFIIYLANFMVRHEAYFKTQFQCFIKPIILLTVASLLLLKQPNFGAIAVLFATSLSMMFLGGSRWLYFIIITSTVTVSLSLLAIAAPYRLHRLTAFLHPWVEQFGSGYQLTQALIAFGRGGIWGQGLGNSIQKLYYLPEAHTDFVFPVLAEELGLIGAISVLILYLMLTLRTLKIAREALYIGRDFDGFLASGIGLWLGIQTLVNIGVNCGILPTKGLTLPLLSYGGTSLLINLMGIAIVLRINHQTKREVNQSKASKPKVARV